MNSDSLSKYTAPLAADSPAGPNLEYDARMMELEEASTPEPEHSIGDSVIPATPPDWRAVEKQAAALMAETRDVRVVVIWTIARLANAGLQGLLDGLEIIRSLAADMWDAHWPQPDDGDVQERISALTRLSPVPGSFDADPTVLHLLLEAPLTASPAFGGLGLASLREAKDSSDAQRTMTAALMDTPAEKVEATAATVAALKDTLAAIRDIYAEHAQGTPDFRMVQDLLKEMQLFLDSRPQPAPAAADPAPAAAPAEEVPAAAAPADAPAAAAPAASQAVPAATVPQAAPLPVSATAIQGRQQAVEQLRLLCEWFETNEPSSPVPYFLRRAIRCVGASFMDIMEDIAPAARDQVRTVLRPDSPAAAPAASSPAPAAPAPVPAAQEQAPENPEGFFNPFG